MYRILVVDDEPAAIKHICNIIAIKYVYRTIIKDKVMIGIILIGCKHSR